MKPLIPIFFSADDNYAPFLAVALRSIFENASRKYKYTVHVLAQDLAPRHKGALRRIASEYGASISFADVSAQMNEIASKLHLRDYYTSATYYRFFIADLFPEYDKALYLDCDIAVNGDVSELYSTDVDGALLAAVPEEVMRDVQVFGDYVEKVLDIPRGEYFNAGVLVMNLKGFREERIKERFVSLLSKRRFDVTQDQDYLNVLSYGKTVLLGTEWNKTPTPDPSFDGVPKLVHYKLNFKPWHYDGVLYGGYFEKYARMTSYRREINKIKNNYSDADRRRDRKAYIELCRLAERECETETGAGLLNA